MCSFQLSELYPFSGSKSFLVAFFYVYFFKMLIIFVQWRFLYLDDSTKICLNTLKSQMKN